MWEVERSTSEADAPVHLHTRVLSWITDKEKPHNFCFFSTDHCIVWPINLWRWLKIKRGGREKKRKGKLVYFWGVGGVGAFLIGIKHFLERVSEPTIKHNCITHMRVFHWMFPGKTWTKSSPSNNHPHVSTRVLHPKICPQKYLKIFIHFYLNFDFRSVLASGDFFPNSPLSSLLSVWRSQTVAGMLPPPPHPLMKHLEKKILWSEFIKSRM